MSKTAIIKSFDDACTALNLSTVLPDTSTWPPKHQKALAAHYQLVIIAEALNDGWQPDWNNYDENKYYPWFDVDASDEQPAGFGLSLCDVVYSLTRAGVGSRLCFKSEELAKYAAEQFAELYKDYLLIGV